jgi:cytochrome o ubiquinol oxidase subunit 2
MRAKVIIVTLLVIDAVLAIFIYLSDKTISVFQTKGTIATQERDLILTATLVMLFVIVPVFVLAFHVFRNYHEGNAKATYRPDWDHDTKLQIFIWGLPSLVILVLAGMVWTSAHRLDPHIAISDETKPITIQVVAMRWKWLFIYPEQRIATVNYVMFPEKTPVHFELTAYDAPMNSFWIPQLGGQIYAMSGMSTQTYLMADAPGEYRGSNAEISGEGFAGMTFTAKSVSQSDFDTWATSVKQSQKALTNEELAVLSKPSEDTPPASYSSTEDNLYTTIVMKYMAHPSNNTHFKHDYSENINNDMPGM